ncbi:MAG: cytochrome c, partial [Deltaproteobacteria bacterium]|nr:cytochrome c [Deltaproteobacteria bacterium]
MRLGVLLACLLIACGKGDKPPPPGSGGLLTQESGPTAGPTRQVQASDARAIFQNQCAMCHGTQGRGDGISASALAVKPRDYTDPKWQASITDDEIKKIIVLGGKGVGKNAAMPDNPTLADRPEVLDGL